MQDEKEKWDQRVAFLISTGIHVALLVLFFVMMAWRTPTPVTPEYGIEVNFGLDAAGDGDVQPEKEIQKGEQTQPDENNVVEQPEVKKEDATPPIEEKNEVAVPIEEKKVKEEKPKVVEEKPKEVKKQEPIPDKPKQEKATDKKAVATYGKPDGVEKGGSQSHGDKPGQVGDMGSPQGELDKKALYGGGSGNGLALSMSGWAWAEDPKLPKVNENESGRIVFEIECDSEGEIVSVQTIERGGVSAQVEQALKAEIRKNSLIPTSMGQKPERSKGRVVFVVKTK